MSNDMLLTSGKSISWLFPVWAPSRFCNWWGNSDTTLLESLRIAICFAVGWISFLITKYRAANYCQVKFPNVQTLAGRYSDFAPTRSKETRQRWDIISDGYSQAIVATAHKIAKIFYTMVKNHTEYDENKTGINERELLERKILITQRRLDKLNRMLTIDVSWVVI